MPAAIDTPNQTSAFKIEGTDYYLVLDYYKENDYAMSPESFEIYIVHKNDKKWMILPDEEDMFPMPKSMENTIIILKKGFKWFQARKK